MENYQKANLLNEGKTKKIWAVESFPDLIIIENKQDITAFDDPKFTRQFEQKAQYATTTTCRVFELLQREKLPLAYVRQISPTEFVAPKCEMIPLEVVARRYAVGSYLKREPKLVRPENQPPFRFDEVVVEFFLKTTRGQLKGKDGRILVDKLDPQKGEEDPFILNPKEASWKLLHPKKASDDPASDLNKIVNANDIVHQLTDIFLMEEVLQKTFLTLERAWENFYSYRLIDIKIEFGYNSAGALLVADVIDNDSWRLRDKNWQELSKEAFRQGEELSEVERKYGLVASLVEKMV